MSWALGLEADSLAAWQMAFRAVVVYPVGIAFVRIGETRFIGKFAAFDVVMGIMIGSILSRAVTGGAPFFATLAAALVLVLLHHLFATLSFHSDWFGDVVKGTGRTLVVGGAIQWDALRRSHISEKDLMSAVRENGGVEQLSRVKLARLERSGNISIVMVDG
ncbi:MAG: DUF421 domain-containing protein [Gemmatimonadales bacterium]